MPLLSCKGTCAGSFRLPIQSKGLRNCVQENYHMREVQTTSTPNTVVCLETSMRKYVVFSLLAASVLAAAEKISVPHLIQMAASDPDSQPFREALLSSFNEGEIKNGTAFIGEGPDFMWAVESAVKPSLFVDDEARPPMRQIRGSYLWFETGKLQTGISHTFHYTAGGKRLGGRFDVPAYGRDSYEHPGVPKGTLSEKLVHTSKIYDGMKSDYWIYVPAQYDPKVPEALMVWHDG